MTPPTQSPLVSVVIPAYNAVDSIGATLESVLADPFERLEVVVIDNANNDGTTDVINQYNDPRLKVVRNTDVLPLTENWNMAVKESSAPYVKLVCADDLLIPGHLERFAQLMEQNRSVALVGGNYDFIDNTGKLLFPGRGITGMTGFLSRNEAARRVVRSGANPIGPPCSVMFRRRDFDAIGGWKSKAIFTIDIGFWISLLHHGDFYGEPTTVAKFRIADGTVSSKSKSQAYQDQLRFNSEIANDPSFEINRADKVIGRLSAPFAKWRRRLLFNLLRFKSLRPFSK